MRTCNDQKCPKHGRLNTRGRVFEGIVVTKDLHHSATIQFERVSFNRKYERYQRAVTRLRTHNPPCINAEVGDRVQVSECRPLSKSKKFVITERIGKDVLFQEKLERRKESLKRVEAHEEAEEKKQEE